MHAALRVALRHLLVHDAAARRHPLHVARAEAAAIPEAVAVLDAARQHVGDRLDAAVRVPREPGEKVVRVVVAEVVEQQERIEFRRVAEPERALQPHAGALDGRFRFTDVLHWPDGHRCLLQRFASAAAFCCAASTCRNSPSTASSSAV